MELQQACVELAEELADVILQYWGREIQLLKQHLAYLKQRDAVPLFVRGQLLEQQLRMELAEQPAGQPNPAASVCIVMCVVHTPLYIT